MIDLSTSLTLKKNLFFPGYQLEYYLKARLSLGEVSEVASLFLKHLYPTMLADSKNDLLVNLKGRPENMQLIPDSPVPHDSEMLFAHGEICSTDDNGELSWEPFQISVTTPFHEFRGPRDGLYSIRIFKSKEISAALPIEVIADALGVTLRGFRFGLEHLRPTNRRFSLGLTPAVEETLTVDANCEYIILKLAVDGSTRNVINPLSDIPIYRKTFELLSQIAACDLQQDFTHKLSIA